MTEPGPQVRLSDPERQQAVDDLFRAHRDGRIELDDLDHRLQAVYAARTVGELAHPLHDLPGPRPWSPRAQQVELIDTTGGLTRTGAWTMSRWTRIEQPVNGGDAVLLDLSVAEIGFAQVEVEMHLGMYGRATLVVPDGGSADLSGVTGRGRPARTDVPSEPSTTTPHLVVTGSTGKRAWVRVRYPGEPSWWETFPLL